MCGTCSTPGNTLLRPEDFLRMVRICQECFQQALYDCERHWTLDRAEVSHTGPASAWRHAFSRWASMALSAALFERLATGHSIVVAQECHIAPSLARGTLVLCSESPGIPCVWGVVQQRSQHDSFQEAFLLHGANMWPDAPPAVSILECERHYFNISHFGSDRPRLRNTQMTLAGSTQSRAFLVLLGVLMAKGSA